MDTCRRMTLAASLAAAVFVLSGTVWAASPGKELTREKCKGCHSLKGQGATWTALSKTQAQWDRFFRRDRHKDAPEAWRDISPQQLETIRRYLHDHAADSPQPETCG